MNAVATREEQTQVPAPVSEVAAIIQVIERAAMNPAVDIEKMERLLAMQERVMARNAKAAYVEALAEMQPELPVIVERGEIKHGDNKPVQSRYALWEDINEAIKPVLAKHGFALSFRTGREGDRIIVTGVLSHRLGHTEDTTMHLPIDASGSKNAVQAVGSSTSYGKRYTAMALLNLTSRGEDDDGKAAGLGPTITPDQAKQIRDLISTTETDIAAFCEFMGVEAVPDISAEHFDAAIRALRRKERERSTRK